MPELNLAELGSTVRRFAKQMINRCLERKKNTKHGKI